MPSGNYNNGALPAPGSQSTGLTRQQYLETSAPNGPEPEGGSSVDYWGLAKRGKWWLLGFGILGGLAGFVALLDTQPVYRSNTTLELQNFNESFMGMNVVDPQAGSGNYTVNQSNINTQIKIIESFSVRVPVAERLSRETTPVLPPARTFLAKLRLRVRRTPPDPLREMQIGLGMALWSVKAKSVTGTRIISISCDSTVPEIASSFVNTLAAEYISQNTQQRSITTQRTSQWLESQLAETRVKLEDAENRLEAFVKQSGIVFSGESENTLTVAKLRQLTGDLAAVQQDRISRQIHFDSMNEMLRKGTPELIPEIGDNVILRQMGTQLVDARKKYAELTARFQPGYPKVVEAQKEIDDLQAAIQKERNNIIQRIRNDYEQALSRENGLKKAYSVEAANVSGQQDKASQYSLLKREVAIYQQTMNLMLQQTNQASVVAAIPANNIRVIDTAHPSGVPIAPDTTYYLGFGVVSGLGGGFGLVFLKALASKRKSTPKFGVPGYAPSVLAVPELGVIPSADFEAGGQTANARWRWRRGKEPLSLKEDGAGEMHGLALTGWQGGPSLLADSFRLTMTSLMLMFRERRPRVLVVTSPGPGEGKTTISGHLAMAMAEAGKKVLLIDLDLRRPHLHTLFNLPNKQGFSDLVNGDEQSLRITSDHPAILATSYPRIFVLPSGQVEPGVLGEMFHSPRVAGVLRRLRECFDAVIVDTPPMLQFSESRLAASLADGVLLVLRSGLTDKESALAARSQLLQDRVELLGTILNDWNPKQSGAARYASYYQSYVRYHSKEGA